MKTTWIWFISESLYDNSARDIKKVYAIEKCLKESFPGCKETKTMPYTRYSDPKHKRRLIESGLIVIINRIGDLVALRYEEKEAGLYKLLVDRTTPVTHRRLRNKSQSEIVSEYRLPTYLDIKKYLSSKKEVKSL